MPTIKQIKKLEFRYTEHGRFIVERRKNVVIRLSDLAKCAKDKRPVESIQSLSQTRQLRIITKEALAYYQTEGNTPTDKQVKKLFESAEETRRLLDAGDTSRLVLFAYWDGILYDDKGKPIKKAIHFSSNTVYDLYRLGLYPKKLGKLFNKDSEQLDLDNLHKYLCQKKFKGKITDIRENQIYCPTDCNRYCVEFTFIPSDEEWKRMVRIAKSRATAACMTNKSSTWWPMYLDTVVWDHLL